MRLFRILNSRARLGIKRNFLIVLLRESFSDLVAFIRRSLGGMSLSQENSHIKRVNLDRFSLQFNENKISQSKQRFVLLDQFPIPQWLVVNSFVAKKIAYDFSATPAVFTFRAPSKISRDIHLVFGLRDFLIVRLNVATCLRVKSEYKKILTYLNDKSPLIDYEIDDIPIGLDIYESVLRLGRVTVSLWDWQTYRVIYLALKQYVFFEELFASKRILTVVVSHDNYVGPGLLAHMAFRYNVPVILGNLTSFSMPTAPFQLYEKFKHFREYASKIEPKELLVGTNWAKSELQKRIEGEIGVGMGYQVKSAFTKERIERQTADTNKTKVVILTHDYFDNPHGYGRMLFDDFSLWLEFLGELSAETAYEWYVKPHRDYSDLEFNALESFVRKFPTVKIINPETSYHQLREEGVEFVMTCYGSAGHELPLLGFTVVNSSYNAHFAYEFNIHAKSLLEYKEIILNLPKLKLQDIDLDKVYEYYYLHKKFTEKDALMGVSQEVLVKLSEGNPIGEEVFEYLVENIEIIQSEVENTMRKTFSLLLVYFYENALPVESRLRIPADLANGEFYKAYASDYS
jgi:hypothetical protein